MRRTKEQAAETRDTILRAAEDLFVENGFDRVSLDEIAAAAGVKRGAVHFHFVNKQGLVAAMCDQGHSPLRELVDRLGTEHTLSALDELLAIGTDCLRAFDGDRRRRAVYRGSLSLSLVDESHPTSVAMQQDVLSLITQALEIAAAAGSLAPPWTATTAALALHAFIIGVLTQWATTEGDASMTPGAVEACTALIASFRTKPKAAAPGAPKRAAAKKKSARKSA